MSRLYNTFEFVGNINIPKNKDKFLEVKDSASGWSGHRLNFAVQESKTNGVFVEMYGGYSKAKQNKVYSFGKGTENNKGGKLEIPWEDRLSPETVDLVADFKKFVIDFTTDQELKEKFEQIRYEIRTLEYKDDPTPEEQDKLHQLKQELAEKDVDRHEFIHEYDAIVFLANKLEEYKNYKFKLTGQVDFSESKGKFYRKFKPTTIEIVPNDTPNQLRSLMDIFFTKDSLDDKDFKKEKKVYVDGYVMCYDGNAKKDQFFPQQLMINASKLDFENETHVKRLEFLKNKFKVTGKGVYHLQWVVNIFRGADTVEFTFNDLTPSQKEAVEFGFNKVEDFAPKGGMLGETLYENRLVKPVLEKLNDHNDFSGGAVESSYEVEDLDFVPAQKDNNKPVDTKPETKTEDKPATSVELDDLFA